MYLVYQFFSFKNFPPTQYRYFNIKGSLFYLFDTTTTLLFGAHSPGQNSTTNSTNSVEFAKRNAYPLILVSTKGTSRTNIINPPLSQSWKTKLARISRGFPLEVFHESLYSLGWSDSVLLLASSRIDVAVVFLDCALAMVDSSMHVTAINIHSILTKLLSLDNFTLDEPS